MVRIQPRSILYKQTGEVGMIERVANSDVAALQAMMSFENLEEEDERMARVGAVAHLQKAASELRLTEIETSVLSVLLSRWAYAFDDKEQHLRVLTERFEAHQGSLARVLALPVDDVTDAIASLERQGLITTQGISHASLTGLIEDNARAMHETLYRDFVDRQGTRLIVHGFDAIEELGNDIVALNIAQPGSEAVKQVKSDLLILKAMHTRTSIDKAWLRDPAAVYLWLDRIAAMEDQVAVLRGSPKTFLAWILHTRRSARVMILSGRLAPQPSSQAA